MSIKNELKIIKDAGVVLHKSNHVGHLWFLPATKKELPKGMTLEENLKEQHYGTHYTELGIMHLAKSLKPISNE